MCHDIGSFYVKFLSVPDRLLQLLVGLFRQTLLHRAVIEDIFSEDLGYIYLFFFLHFSFLSKKRRAGASPACPQFL